MKSGDFEYIFKRVRKHLAAPGVGVVATFASGRRPGAERLARGRYTIEQIMRTDLDDLLSVEDDAQRREYHPSLLRMEPVGFVVGEAQHQRQQVRWPPLPEAILLLGHFKFKEHVKNPEFNVYTALFEDRHGKIELMTFSDIHNFIQDDCYLVVFQPSFGADAKYNLIDVIYNTSTNECDIW